MRDWQKNRTLRGSDTEIIPSCVRYRLTCSMELAPSDLLNLVNSGSRYLGGNGISAILRDQFGILPKRKAIGYSKPYPSDYDLIPLPPKYRLPEFTKFSGF